MERLITVESMKTCSVGILGIASSSWSSIKSFFAEAAIIKPSLYDLTIARLIAGASLVYVLIKIYKAVKSRKKPQREEEEE